MDDLQWNILLKWMIWGTFIMNHMNLHSGHHFSLRLYPSLNKGSGKKTTWGRNLRGSVLWSVAETCLSDAVCIAGIPVPLTTHRMTSTEFFVVLQTSHVVKLLTAWQKKSQHRISMDIIKDLGQNPFRRKKDLGQNNLQRQDFCPGRTYGNRQF